MVSNRRDEGKEEKGQMMNRYEEKIGDKHIDTDVYRNERDTHKRMVEEKIRGDEWWKLFIQ